MRLTILGATGRSGRALGQLAVAQGDAVTAIVRDPGRLAFAATTTVRADVNSASELASAFAGTDAVAFCLGPASAADNGILHAAMVATVEAMAAAGARRLVTISASGPYIDGDDPLTRYVAKPIVQRVLRENFVDVKAMERDIRQSQLDWTIFRPPQLLDRPATGRYTSRRDGNVRWGFRITRGDLAQAMVDALADDSTIGQTISVSN